MKMLGYLLGAASVVSATGAIAVLLPRQATADASAASPPAAVDRGSPPAAVPSQPLATDEAPQAPEFPDLTQTDPALDVPGSGNSYCGPVAVSNSLIWLAQGDYPALAPDAPTQREQQLELVRRLSSPRYMATSPTMGTGAFGLMKGVERWVTDAGYEIARLEYQGWRGHPLKFATYVKVPRLEWLASALADHGAAWLHVGWYRPPTRWEPAYQRHGGHWLTLVKVEGDGTLALHDPAPYAGTKPSTERVSTRAIESGWILDGQSRLRADGHLILEGGMHVKRDGELAILDGAVTLVLARPSRNQAGDWIP
jgi:hypothetical protein